MQAFKRDGPEGFVGLRPRRVPSLSERCDSQDPAAGGQDLAGVTEAGSSVIDPEAGFLRIAVRRLESFDGNSLLVGSGVASRGGHDADGISLIPLQHQVLETAGHAGCLEDGEGVGLQA